MTSNVNFIYNHCTPADFSHDISFKEDFFREILSDCFLIEPSLSKIEVFFDMHPGQSTEKFNCAIHIISNASTHYVKESSQDNYTQTVNKACKKALVLLRENKDRATKNQHASIE